MSNKYKVRLEYHTVIVEKVEADSEGEAIEAAKDNISSIDIGVNAETYSVNVTEI